MNHLMPHQQPAWIEFGFPELYHWAAAAAWEHTGSRYVLLKLWYPNDPDGHVGGGAWHYELRSAGGQHRRVALVTFDDDPRPVERLLELAEAAIRVMEAEPSAGGGGNSGGPGV